MPNNFTRIQIRSTTILDKTILDIDVNDAAAIKFSKLLSSAINAALVPDGDNTRDSGGAAKRWANSYNYKLFATYVGTSLDPWVTDGYALGGAARRWLVAHIKDDIFIKGINAEIYYNCVSG